MTTNGQHFNAATSRLHHTVNLIEASAGTGKTYAIAMLVLRFITEHGFPIENILLVTFTRAATSELAERIRLRLAEARELLKGNLDNADPTLVSWADKLDNRKLALDRIMMALNDMDRAAIFTIHGFCQRMLQDQALESGQLFDVELMADASQVRQQVAEDFWRRTLYDMTPEQCGLITSAYPTPEKLLESVEVLLAPGLVVEPDVVVPEVAGKVTARSFQTMALWWRKKSKALHSALATLVAEQKMKKEFSKDFSWWWQDIDRFFTHSQKRLPKGLYLLRRDGFVSAMNKTKIRGQKREELLAEMPLPDEEINAFMEAADAFILSVRVSFVKYLAAEIDRRMRQKNAMSYSDLIFQLHMAVTSSHGARLRDILKQRYNAALIDEFQDTDVEQWQIFNTIFGKGAYLYLIGDPKQAIYRFRGADINSYFLAREYAEKRMTLEKNYRSHPGVVREVNRLFQARKNPFVLADSTLVFSPVLPARTEDEEYLEQRGKKLENVVHCQLLESSDTKDGRWTSTAAAASIRNFVVREISHLLDNDVSLCKENSQKRLLQPHDIAVLVRNNSHADDYLESLAEAGIPAVIASRKSIFLTEECRELYILLKSLATVPISSEYLSRAMTVSWLGLTGNELYRILHTEEFDQWLEHFHAYAEIWRDRGVLLMMSRFLSDEKVFIVLGNSALAERRIANINHLLERIQEAETEYMLDPGQTLQWLRDVMRREESEEQLRLESDEEAVRIVTMHGAKGLEYPVVFCPYLWYRQAGEKRLKDSLITYENDTRIVDLGSDRFDMRRKKIVEEEFAEDMRLLYVALTRARLRCYTIWCDVRGRSGGPVDSFSSTLGYLFFPAGGIDFSGQQQQLQSFGDNKSVGYLGISPDHPLPDIRVAKKEGYSLSCKKTVRVLFENDYQMTSYSALASISVHGAAGEDEEVNEDDEKRTEFAALPQGARFGNVVHDILEKVPFGELLQPGKHRHLIEQICRKYGVEADMALLERLLHIIVATPFGNSQGLGKSKIKLADINESSCIKEMGFYFHLERSETARINQILAKEETVLPLSDKVIEGYLTGFVDLIFEHGGKYYVVDYKTNTLGENFSHYNRTGLVKAMAAHNYGLQYWLYSLVLHRHLGNFLPAYDYEEHFGGVFYLFVRGMRKQSNSGVFYDKPGLPALLRLNRCLGGGA